MATAASDGFFGPTELRTSLNGGLDPWPYMPMMHALRSAYEFSGEGAILTLMTHHGLAPSLHGPFCFAS